MLPENFDRTCTTQNERNLRAHPASACRLEISIGAPVAPDVLGVSIYPGEHFRPKGLREGARVRCCSHRRETACAVFLKLTRGATDNS